MFFLWVILFFIVVYILIINISIKIELKDFIINVPKIKNEYIDPVSKLVINFYILKKIKIFKITVGKNKNEKEKIEEKLKKIAPSIEKYDDFGMGILKLFKEFNIKLENLNLKVVVGQEDAAITAISVGIISSIVSILLRKVDSDSEKMKYEIIPIYQNKNILNIKLNCIFRTNMRNIINIVSKILKKRRVDKNGGASDRRSYAYSDG